MWSRFVRWRRFRRELAELVNDHLDNGYNVSAETEAQYRRQARQAAGYPVEYYFLGAKRW